MASEHTLSLKAVLDTSDVQQKLNQLKQQQQSGENGLAGGGIQQALMRLNTILMNLQRSIDRLAGQGGRNGGPTYGPSSKGYPPVAPSNGNLGKLQDMTSSKFSQMQALISQQNQMFRQVATQAFNTKLTPQEQQVMKLRGIDPARKDFVPNLRAAIAQYEKYGKDGIKGREFRYGLGGERNPPRNAKPAESTTPVMPQSQPRGRMGPEQKAQLRNVSRLAFGVVAGGAADYFEATGHKTAATAAGLVSNVGMSAAMGGMMGGPVGAGIGAVTGLVTSAFEELTKSAREAAAALEEQSKAVMHGQNVDNKLYSYFQQKNDQKAMEKGNYSYFQKQFKEADDKYKRVEAKLKEEVGLGGEGLERFNLREYSKETKRLMELRGKDDAEVQRRQKVEQLYTANADVLIEAGERRDEMKKAMQELTSPGADWETGLPKMKDRWATPGQGKIRDWFDPEIRYLKKQSHYYDEFGVKHESKEEYSDSEWWQIVQGKTIAQGRASAAKDAIAELKETLAGMKAPDMSPVNSLASQGFMIGNGSEDDNLLNETNKYLNEIAHLTREIKDKEAEAATYVG